MDQVDPVNEVSRRIRAMLNGEFRHLEAQHVVLALVNVAAFVALGLYRLTPDQFGEFACEVAKQKELDVLTWLRRGQG